MYDMLDVLMVVPSVILCVGERWMECKVLMSLYPHETVSWES